MTGSTTKPNVLEMIKVAKNLQKQQKIQAAISTYKEIILLTKNRYHLRQINLNLSYLHIQQEATNLAKQHFCLGIADNCLINHKYQIIYFPIPKNACTLFKTMMVEHSSDRQKYLNSEANIHCYGSSRQDTAVFLDNIDYLTNPDYFKFAILRNPFDRLVSAYLDKIVKHKIPESFAQELIRNVQNFFDKDYDLEKSISFQELLQYLAKTKDHDLNEHWQSQSSFLGKDLIEFDYFGKFEQLSHVVEFLENKFKFKITIDVNKNHNRSDHVTNYVDNIVSEKYQEKYPQELRHFQFNNRGFPAKDYFYTPELIDLVKIRFAQDIKLYENEFSEQLL